jgi:preprotein translocase subunit SecD
MITSARVEPQGASWAVTAEFNGEGAKLLGDISRQLLNKPMGIFLDNKLISDPVVRSELPSGNVQITGNFSAQEANELMTFLKAGSLPVPLEVIENRTVEASLGNESVKATLISGIIGAVAVMVFMVVVYQLPGMLANIALVIYSLLVLAIFKLIPVTLTVPGVAAFILSVGMAVDANILIFERTKEELRDKRTLYAAIEIGFKRAFSAIFDSNINSLITCVILFWFGTGPVKGFALTLAIGVLVSMFTAITATRSLLHWVLEARQERRTLGKGGDDGGTLFGVQMPSKIR